MLRDLICFLAALWAEWKVLLTGGTISAGLVGWALSTGKAAPRNISWIVLGLTLALAAFFAWRKEWVRGDRGFIDVTVSELYRLYETGHTSIQKDAIIKPYVGKWIRARGRVRNVHTDFIFCYLTIGHFDGDNDWLTVITEVVPVLVECSGSRLAARYATCSC